MSYRFSDTSKATNYPNGDMYYFIPGLTSIPITLSSIATISLLYLYTYITVFNLYHFIHTYAQEPIMALIIKSIFSSPVLKAFL